MPRQLKPQKVGEFRHPKMEDTVIDIMLDRNELAFFATFGDEEIARPSKNELIIELQKLAETASHVDWQPVMEVSEHLPWVDSGKDPIPCVCFSVRRFWYGYRSDGRHVQCHWSYTTNEQRSRGYNNFGWKKGEPLTLPYVAEPKSSRGEVTYYMPYDETTYNALVQLMENIRQVRARFQALLSTPTGVQQLVGLVTGGLMALPPAAEESSSQ